jgi:hypothetical protein
VEENNTSNHPKRLDKKAFHKNYYCYTLPDQILNFTKRERIMHGAIQNIEIKNYYINYGIIYIMKYYDFYRTI